MKQCTTGQAYPVYQVPLANGVPIGAGGSIASTFNIPGDRREAWWLLRQNSAGYLSFGLLPTIQWVAYNIATDDTTFLVGITNITAGSITPSSNVLVDCMFIFDDTES
jgi:hypothetical protein